MVAREIVSYGVDEPIPLSIIPPRGVVPVLSNQSYFAQAIHHPLIALLPPHLLLEGNPSHQEPQLDVPKLIKVTKDINLLHPKGHEVLTRVKTNKFRDVTCVKYKSVTPCTTIDGVRATPK
jgi:hypothetical protein